jgi:hypothetical protein
MIIDEIATVVLLIAAAFAVMVALQLRTHWPLLWYAVLVSLWLVLSLGWRAIQSQAPLTILAAVVAALIPVPVAVKAWQAFKARE